MHRFLRIANCQFRRKFHTLPFKISREQANKKLLTDRKFLDETGKADFKMFMFGKSSAAELVNTKGDPVRERYIPFHSIDVSNLKSRYIGHRGYDRTEYYTVWVYNAALKMSMPVTQSRTVTDWSPAAGELNPNDYPLGTIETQIYAGFKYPRLFLNKALRTHHIFKDLVPLTKEMIEKNKPTVEPHEMKYAMALDKINAALHDYEIRRAKDDICRKHGADRASITQLDMQLGEAQITPHSYYVPAYIYCGEAQVDDLTSYKFINGFTGNIEGESTKSFWKSLAFGSGVGAMATSVGTYLLFPALGMSQLLLRTFAGAAVSGLSFSSVMRARSIILNSKYSKEQNDDIKTNDAYYETDDDKKRRNFAEHFSVVDSKYKDTCLLFGLDFTKEFTLIDLKKRYHEQLIIWHPDQYKGDKKIAEDMTILLKTSYHELEKFAKKLDER
ncbi:MAG: DnaJ-like subfamily C member 3 [Hyperionvirus sp.]|uniref:DnaJ-like subfamily C member 3 n=1 Tax=Hyperionvirus sp. TaxID=2487770 RepID=A0A3G5A858_9VIRU|nr:MAG: DnaJ-like subfamily C member 3 [Hyperionvirus sp.]